MANYLTTDTDLTAVADAIRTKGGTSASLAFPADFVSAIAAISGGENIELLGSGDYVLSSDSSAFELQIPVTAQGASCIVFVVKDSITSGVAQAHTWLRYLGAGVPTEARGAFVCTALTKGYGANTNQYKYAGGTTTGDYNGSYLLSQDFAFSPEWIKIRRISASYPFKADTYHWYIWGIKS